MTIAWHGVRVLTSECEFASYVNNVNGDIGAFTADISSQLLCVLFTYRDIPLNPGHSRKQDLGWNTTYLDRHENIEANHYLQAEKYNHAISNEEVQHGDTAEFSLPDGYHLMRER